MACSCLFFQIEIEETSNADGKFLVQRERLKMCERERNARARRHRRWNKMVLRTQVGKLGFDRKWEGEDG